MSIPAPPTAIIASRTKNIAIPVFGGVVPGGVVGGVVLIIYVQDFYNCLVYNKIKVV